MEAAYDALGDTMKSMLDGLVAVHDFTLCVRVRERRRAGRAAREVSALVEHPVIRTHPVTGRKSIYVNVAFTSHIKGMRFDESGQLLRLLTRKASVPEYQCRIHWAPDSLALDNLCAQHYAVSDYWPERRVMERVTVVVTDPADARRAPRSRPSGHGRVGCRGPAAVGRRRPSLADRVRGDAAGAADDAGGGGRRSGHPGRAPGAEAPRVVERSEFTIRPWAETDDPLDVVAGLAGPAARLAIGDRTWAQFVLGLQERMPGARFQRASDVTGPLRVVKDEAEVEALARGRCGRRPASWRTSRPARSPWWGGPKRRCRPIWGAASWPRATTG